MANGTPTRSRVATQWAEEEAHDIAAKTWRNLRLAVTDASDFAATIVAPQLQAFATMTESAYVENADCIPTADEEALDVAMLQRMHVHLTAALAVVVDAVERVGELLAQMGDHG